MGKSLFHYSTFKKQVLFDRCRFEDYFELQSCHFEESASFYRAEFSKRTFFKARFAASCNLNETIFREGVSFAGWTESVATISEIISFLQPPKPTFFESLHKKIKQIPSKFKNRIHQEIRRFSTQSKGIKVYKVFEGEGQLVNVQFIKPDQVSFSSVNLAKVYFSGTNLRGVRFLGVNWWQPVLGRNGLYDELFIRLSRDGSFRFQNLPSLEQTCRNIRVSLEESRDFNVASDFYIAEMEALQARLPFLRRYLFSVVALYRYVSYYGTSVGRAVFVLTLLSILHLGISFLLHSPVNIAEIKSHISDDTLHTVKIMTLQMFGYGNKVELSIEQQWVDAVFRALSPVQIAMLILAFRARIKRN